MQNYDSGPAVTAVEIYLWKSKVSFELRQMNSTDERGDITEVAKPLLSRCGGLEEMGHSSLRRQRNLSDRNCPVALEVRAIL